MAPPITKRPTIIITTDEEKPANASVGVRIPQTIRVVSAVRATMSDLILPIMNIVIVIPNTIKVVNM
jgi:hypothetical protein